MLEVRGSIQNARDLFRTQHRGQAAPTFGSGNLLVKPRLLKHPNVQKLERSPVHLSGPGVLPIIEQGQPVLADILRSQLLRRFSEVLGKSGYQPSICADRCLGEIAQLQLLHHSFP